MPNVRTSSTAAPSPLQGAAKSALAPQPSRPSSAGPAAAVPDTAHAAAAATSPSSSSSSFIDWSHIDLVIFDVDGTLYDQRKLRWAMLKLLLQHAWQTRSLDTLLTLRAFRQIREALGDQTGADFMRLQYAQTASRRGKTPTEVREMAIEWMEARPLPLLAGCRYPQVAELFAGLRAAGKQIAVFSDYPAGAKLVALGLDNVAPASAAAGQPDHRGDSQDDLDSGNSSDFGDFWKPGELDEPGERGEASTYALRAAAKKAAGADGPEARGIESEIAPETGAETEIRREIDFGVPPAAQLRPIGPIVCATDPDISRLKPDPAGLLAILRLTGVPPGRALMIGDRFDRDALAAERAGIRCMIRGRKPLTAGAHPRAQTFGAYDDLVFKPVLPG